MIALPRGLGRILPSFEAARSAVGKLVHALPLGPPPVFPELGCSTRVAEGRSGGGPGDRSNLARSARVDHRRLRPASGARVPWLDVAE